MPTPTSLLGDENASFQESSQGGTTTPQRGLKRTYSERIEMPDSYSPHKRQKRSSDNPLLNFEMIEELGHMKTLNKIAKSLNIRNQSKKSKKAKPRKVQRKKKASARSPKKTNWQKAFEDAENQFNLAKEYSERTYSLTYISKAGDGKSHNINFLLTNGKNPSDFAPDELPAYSRRLTSSGEDGEIKHTTEGITTVPIRFAYGESKKYFLEYLSVDEYQARCNALNKEADMDLLAKCRKGEREQIYPDAHIHYHLSAISLVEQIALKQCWVYDKYQFLLENNLEIVDLPGLADHKNADLKREWISTLLPNIDIIHLFCDSARMAVELRTVVQLHELGTFKNCEVAPKVVLHDKAQRVEFANSDQIKESIDAVGSKDPIVEMTYIFSHLYDVPDILHAHEEEKSWQAAITKIPPEAKAVQDQPPIPLENRTKVLTQLFEQLETFILFNRPIEFGPLISYDSLKREKEIIAHRRAYITHILLQESLEYCRVAYNAISQYCLGNCRGVKKHATSMYMKFKRLLRAVAKQSTPAEGIELSGEAVKYVIRSQFETVKSQLLQHLREDLFKVLFGDSEKSLKFFLSPNLSNRGDMKKMLETCNCTIRTLPKESDKLHFYLVDKQDKNSKTAQPASERVAGYIVLDSKYILDCFKGTKLLPIDSYIISCSADLKKQAKKDIQSLIDSQELDQKIQYKVGLIDHCTTYASIWERKISTLANYLIEDARRNHDFHGQFIFGDITDFFESCAESVESIESRKDMPPTQKKILTACRFDPFLDLFHSKVNVENGDEIQFLQWHKQCQKRIDEISSFLRTEQSLSTTQNIREKGLDNSLPPAKETLKSEYMLPKRPPKEFATINELIQSDSTSERRERRILHVLHPRNHFSKPPLNRIRREKKYEIAFQSEEISGSEKLSFKNILPDQQVSWDDVHFANIRHIRLSLDEKHKVCKFDDRFCRTGNDTENDLELALIPFRQAGLSQPKRLAPIFVPSYHRVASKKMKRSYDEFTPNLFLHLDESMLHVNVVAIPRRDFIYYKQHFDAEQFHSKLFFVVYDEGVEYVEGEGHRQVLGVGRIRTLLMSLATKWELSFYWLMDDDIHGFREHVGLTSEKVASRYACERALRFCQKLMDDNLFPAEDKKTRAEVFEQSLFTFLQEIRVPENSSDYSVEGRALSMEEMMRVMSLFLDPSFKMEAVDNPHYLFDQLSCSNDDLIKPISQALCDAFKKKLCHPIGQVSIRNKREQNGKDKLASSRYSTHMVTLVRFQVVLQNNILNRGVKPISEEKFWEKPWTHKDLVIERKKLSEAIARKKSSTTKQKKLDGKKTDIGQKLMASGYKFSDYHYVMQLLLHSISGYLTYWYDFDTQNIPSGVDGDGSVATD